MCAFVQLDPVLCFIFDNAKWQRRIERYEEIAHDPNYDENVSMKIGVDNPNELKCGFLGDVLVQNICWNW